MKVFSKAVLPLALVCLTATPLSGCKLSDLVDREESENIIVVQGRAQAGKPISAGYIEVKGKNGKEFQVASNSDGSFSLRYDREEYQEEPLEGPLIIRATINEDTLHSVLCNPVYGEEDVVNVNPLTQYVLSQVANTDGIYDNWNNGASDTFCSEGFVTTYRNVASTLGSTFGFFANPFVANGKGFDALLDGFIANGITVTPATSDFHLINEFGSLVLTSDTAWFAVVNGSLGSETFNLSSEDEGTLELALNRAALTDFIGGVLDEFTDIGGGELPEINDLNFSLSGSGIGEVGTTATLTLKGNASVAGASIINQRFKITLDLERIAVLK